MNDLPPRKTLVMLFRSLQYAQSTEERMEIVRAARDVRQKMVTEKETEGELSPLAKRILSRCAGQTVSVQVMARAVQKSYSGSSFKKALKSLRAGKHLQDVGKGMYHIPEATANSDLRCGKVSLSAAKS